MAISVVALSYPACASSTFGTKIDCAPPSFTVLPGSRACTVMSDGIVAINSRTRPRSRCTRSPSRTSAPAAFQSAMATGSRKTTPTVSRISIDAASIRSTCPGDIGSVSGNPRVSCASIASRIVRREERPPRRCLPVAATVIE